MEKSVRKLSKVMSSGRHVNYVLFILHVRIFRRNTTPFCVDSKICKQLRPGKIYCIEICKRDEARCARRMQTIKCYTWGRILRETLGTSRFCLPNCGLGSRHPELLSTSRLGRVILGLVRLNTSECWDGSQDRNYYWVLLMQLLRLKIHRNVADYCGYINRDSNCWTQLQAVRYRPS